MHRIWSATTPLRIKTDSLGTRSRFVREENQDCITAWFAEGSGYSGWEFVPHFHHCAVVPDGHAPFLGEIDALDRPSIGQRVGPELDIAEEGVKELVDVVEGIS